MTFGLSLTGQVECHFVKTDEGYNLRYVRFCSERGIGGSTPEIPVVADPWGSVKVKAEGAYHKRNNVTEYVGNNTLTYLFTRYNGWVDGGKTSSDPATLRQAGTGEEAVSDFWDQFLHNNKSQVKEMLLNLTNPKKMWLQSFKGVWKR